ncbi:MAG: hypothetical protein V3T72_13390 [Thermoanaerobaculia bacterium]
MDGESYFLDQARRWIAALPAGGLQRRLEEAAAAYREALAVQDLDPARVDRIEDDLQDLFEEAESLLDQR